MSIVLHGPVVATAMAKSPADRYPTAAQFAIALRNAAAGRVAVSRPRRRWSCAAAAAFVLAGAILLRSPASRTTGAENILRMRPNDDPARPPRPQFLRASC